MDWSEIKRLADESRALSVQINGRTFRLRVPTEIQARIAFARARDANRDSPSAAQILFTEALLRESLIGWHGVTLSDLGIVSITDAGSDILQWSSDGVEVLLQENTPWRDELASRLMEAYNERTKRIDDAKKN